VTDPLVFFYGQLSPGDNPKLFNVVVDNLAATVEQRFASDSVGAFQTEERRGKSLSAAYSRRKMLLTLCVWRVNSTRIGLYHQHVRLCGGHRLPNAYARRGRLQRHAT